MACISYKKKLIVEVIAIIFVICFSVFFIFKDSIIFKREVEYYRKHGVNLVEYSLNQGRERYEDKLRRGDMTEIRLSKTQFREKAIKAIEKGIDLTLVIDSQNYNIWIVSYDFESYNATLYWWSPK